MNSENAAYPEQVKTHVVVKDDKRLPISDIPQEFLKIAAMAEALSALVHQHEDSDGDQILVATWLNLEVMIDRATKLGATFSSLSTAEVSYSN